MKTQTKKMLAAFAAALAASGAWANNAFQQVTADDSGNYLTSADANWSGGTAPVGSSDSYYSSACVEFSSAYTATFDTWHYLSYGPSIWVGTTGTAFDSDSAVWKSADGTNCGVTASGTIAIANASGQKGSLEIDGGAYSFSAAYLGANGGTAYLTVKDGTLTTTTGDIFVGYKGGESHLTIDGGEVKSAYWFCTGRDAATTSYVTVNGGLLETGTKEGNYNGAFDLSSYAGSKTYFTQTGGSVKGYYGGNMKAAMGVGVGSSSYAEIVIKGGDMTMGNQVNIAPTAGSTGKIIVQGGAFTNSSFMCVGINNDGANALLQVDDGEVYNNGTTTLGSAMGNGSEAKLVVNGGTYTTTGDTYIGEGYTRNDTNPNGTAELVVNGGTFDNSNGDTWIGRISELNNAGYTATLTLSNGTYKTKHFYCGTGVFTGNIAFDGGTLQAAVSGTLIPANDYLTVAVGDEGGTLDTQGYYVTVTEDLTGTGTLTKVGQGMLTLSGDVEGGLDVEEGALAVDRGYAFNTLTVGEAGSLVVNITDDSVTEGDTITLFTAKTLDLDGDALADAIALAGPACLYTLSSETSDGVTTVKATIGTVLAGETMAVRLWGANGREDISTTFMDIAGAYWGGVAPTTNDTVIISGDAVINGYAGNTGKFRRLLVRGGTAKFKAGYAYNTKSGYPTLAVGYIGGNGVLLLSRHGIEAAPLGTTEISSGLTVEASYEYFTGDCWLTGAITANCDFIATNGYLRVYSGGSALNGTITLGNVANGTASQLYIQATDVTFGDDMTLVLAAGSSEATLTNSSGLGFPHVIVEGGTWAYDSLPTLASTDTGYTVNGGTVYYTLTAGDAAQTELELATAVTVNDGEFVVNLDSVTVEAIEDGSTFTITGVTLSGTGTARVTGAEYDWSVTTSETGSIVLTAATPTDAVNYWLGEDGGDWRKAANWKYGVPTSSQTLAFSSDTTICYYSSGAMYAKTIEFSNGANLTIKSSNQSSYYGQLTFAEAPTGEGTITLYRAGIEGGITIPDTISLVVTNNGTNDSWLRNVTIEGNVEITDSSKFYIYGGTTVNGNITGGSGALLNIVQGTATLGGDNSGFYGTVTAEYSRYGNGLITFTNADAGSEEAAWIFNDDMTMNFDDGTIKFGNLITYNQKMYKCNPDKTVTIEIGKRGEASSISNLAFFGDLAWDNTNYPLTNYTLKKVGSGTLTYASYGVPNFVVEEGELELAPTLYNDSHAVLGVTKITVEEGAVLSGTLTGELDADDTTLNDTQTHSQEIETVEFAAGAIVRQTVTKTEDEVEEGEDQTYTYSCPVLALNGSVDVSGVLFDLIDGTDDDEILTAATYAGNLTVLTATAVSPLGRQKAYREIVMSENDKYGWLPRATSTSVYFGVGKLTPGFTIIIR